jgi:hypothetical protein
MPPARSRSARRHHGFALGKTEAETVDQILPARLIGIEERAFDLGPDSVRPAADRRRGDEPGIRAPAREQALDIVARHQHIAVGNDDPVIVGGAPAFQHVIELRVRAHALVADQELYAGFGVLGDQVPHKRQYGIPVSGSAEQYLAVGIIEFECRTQRIGGIIVDSAQRAHQTDGRMEFGQRRLRGLPQANNRDREAGDLDQRDGDAESGGGENRRGHRGNF